MPWSVGGKSSISQTTESGTSQARTSGNETSKQVTQRLDNNSIANLTALLGTIQGNLTGPDQYSKEAALQDSEGVVKQLFAEYSKTLLPQIISKASQSGAYNSSAAQLLADNAFAETVNRAAEVKLNTVAQYAQASAQKQQTQTQTLGTILQGLLQARETTDLASVVNSVTNSSYKGKSTTQAHQIQAKFGYN